MLALIALVAMPLAAQDTDYEPHGSQIPGPSNPSAAGDHCCATGGERPPSVAEWKAWLADIRHWRTEHLVRIGYNGGQYDRPELKWTESSFIQPQMMAHERYFYDPVAHKYTVERYLEDLTKRYGGIDSVLIWPTYPNIGVDDRNQFDLIRDMPGGIDGLRAMVSDLHAHGVRVLFPYNPWDLGTRPEGAPDWETIAHLMAAIGADGINGDTMGAVPLIFRTTSDATGHPIAFEPEGGDSGENDPAIAWNNLAWAYWSFPFEPMVAKNKWLESRQMAHVSDRWARDKTDDLQFAFFNGVGYESWENVWGIWNQIDDRDAEALRRISFIYRGFSTLLVSQDWAPHYPMLQYGAFASKFPGASETLWTIVNRNESNLFGRQIQVDYAPGTHYYDLWNGVELAPEVDGSTATLSFPMEAHGYCAIVTAEDLTGPQHKLLATIHVWAAKPLSSYSHEWHYLPQRIVQITPTAPAASAPAGMVKVPAAEFDFRVSGVMVEGGNDLGVDVQYPWEASARRQHLHRLHVNSFYIDKYPVTNADFKKFMDATHYLPEDDHNFLRDWKRGSYPSGWAAKPVTWVSLEDARAYAAWAGKRLPHEWEWQLAAQGTDGRLYPWGNEWKAADVPVPDKARTLRGPDDVTAHTKGASPYGVMDLVGNVWQWTDEFDDEHTRAAIVRGGNYYQPQGSRWYFPEAYRLDEHGKYLLMAPSLDRSGTIGFRCAVDAAP
jgi:formylglycine-generating enzyme required for sulfatase activity